MVMRLETTKKVYDFVMSTITLDSPKKLSLEEMNQLEQQDAAFQTIFHQEVSVALEQIKTGEEVSEYATREDFEVMLHSRLRAHTEKVSNKPR